MDLTDTGSYLEFDSGMRKDYVAYADLNITVKGSNIEFFNKYTAHRISDVDYGDITLTGIAGVTTAEELADYILSK